MSKREPLLSDEDIERRATDYAEEMNSCYTNDLDGWDAGGRAVRIKHPQRPEQ